MPIVLAADNYGKSRVRMVKVTRRPDRHDLAELTVNIQFEGDFDAVHIAGDNSPVLPTDTMKNTVYELGKAWSGEQIEDIGMQLPAHLRSGTLEETRVRVVIVMSTWSRMGTQSVKR